MMTKKETKQQAKVEYRSFVNPTQFNEFLDGQGALSNRAEVAEQFDYDWHARKLKFEQHFRGQVLLQATAYRPLGLTVPISRSCWAIWRTNKG